MGINVLPELDKVLRKQPSKSDPEELLWISGYAEYLSGILVDDKK